MSQKQIDSQAEALFNLYWQIKTIQLKKHFEEFIASLRQDEKALKRKKKLLNAEKWMTENDARLFDATCHPSQIEVIINQCAEEEKAKLRIKWRQDNEISTSFLVDIINNLKEKAREAWTNRNADYIPSIAQITPVDIEGVNHLFINEDDPQEIARKLAKNPLRHVANYNELDEVSEIITDAKNWLLNGQSIYNIWLDYDGAKRPAGFGYSIFTALAIEDISRRPLKESKLTEAKKLFSQSQRLDIAIREVSVIAANADTTGVRYKKIKETLRILKQKRRDALCRIVNIRDEKTTNKATSEISLSKRIRISVRIDIETANAGILIAEERNGGKPNEQWTIEEHDRVDLFRNIIQQVAELNEISTINDAPDHPVQPIVFQIMVANCGPTPKAAVAQLSAIRAALLTAEASWQTIAGSNHKITDTILLVPLFESPETTNPKFITDFLDEEWEQLGVNLYDSPKKQNEDRREAFIKKRREVFFAGSDTSRQMGSLAARVNVEATAYAAYQWAKQHQVFINVKFGTGESAFRQGGFIDPEGNKPIACGRLLQGENPEAAATWHSVFGANWKKIRKYTLGFEHIFKNSAAINSFTMQSRARERMMSEITPSAQRRALTSIQALRQEARKKIQLKPNPTEIKLATKAARIGNTSWQALFYSPDGKPDGYTGIAALLELLAKTAEFTRRDRANSRSTQTKSKTDLITKGGINSRAIAACAAGNFAMPLFLLEKGDILDGLKSDNERQKVFAHEQMRLLLREAKFFRAIAPDFFAEMKKHESWRPAAHELERRWNALEKHQKLLKNVLLEQELGLENARKFKKARPQQQKQIIDTAVPGIRELLDDDFQSRYTQLAVAGWHATHPVLKASLAYLADTKQDKKALRLALERADVTAAQKSISFGLNRVG